MKIHELTPVYVEQMPDILEPGKLYISKRFQLTIHLCACGCGIKTPIPVRGLESWTMTDNGGKITIRPSIGNWKGESPYHAHYYITDNKIQWL
jgi:hypothetical protein